MYETINEKIDVVAIFGKGFKEVRPFKVRWGTKEHIIKKVGYVHTVKQGRKMIHVFSATDGAQFFELRFDPSDLSWFIGRVWDDDRKV